MLPTAGARVSSLAVPAAGAVAAGCGTDLLAPLASWSRACSPTIPSCCSCLCGHLDWQHQLPASLTPPCRCSARWWLFGLAARAARMARACWGWPSVSWASGCCPGTRRVPAGGSGWAVLACLGATPATGPSANAAKKYPERYRLLPPRPAARSARPWRWPCLRPWPSARRTCRAWLPAALLVLGVLCPGAAYILYFRPTAARPARAVTGPSPCRCSQVLAACCCWARRSRVGCRCAAPWWCWARHWSGVLVPAGTIGELSSA